MDLRENLLVSSQIVSCSREWWHQARTEDMMENRGRYMRSCHISYTLWSNHKNEMRALKERDAIRLHLFSRHENDQTLPARLKVVFNIQKIPSRFSAFSANSFPSRCPKHLMVIPSVHLRESKQTFQTG